MEMNVEKNNMAIDSTTLPSKKKIRVSKNKKKNWNKVCNIDDIEEYLEEKRFQERIGIKIDSCLVSQESNAELFFLDTTTEHETENKKLKKPFKCFQNIGAFSKVSPPVDPNRIQFTKKIKNTLLKREKKKLIKLLQTPSNKTTFKKNETGTLFTANFHDLWDIDKKEDTEIKELIDYHDEITNKKIPKVPKLRYQKPSLLPAVEVPHSGASYNPNFEDHQTLLLEAVKIEEKKEKDELHLERVLTHMFPTKNEAPTEESVLKEMAQGLFDEEEKQSEQPLDENCALTKNPPISYQDRIPKSHKKKRKLLKEMERQNKLEKLQKKRENEIFRLKSIKAELKKEAAISEEKKKKREKQKIEKLYKPRTLSKYKYEPPEVEVNLTEELRGSLRAIKVEGNILEDRYKSLQRRNLIEPRIKQKRKRKYKLKVQIKRSHRNTS